MNAPSTRRLLSLDVFRGITIVGMMIVNSPGNSTAYAPLEHAEWHGCTPTDLVFPFFIFIVGVSLVFSFTSRRAQKQTKMELFRQIIKRTAIIFGIGLLLNGFPYYHWTGLRILGVLQRIALCYFFAAFFYLSLNRKMIGTLIGVFLIGYWLIMTRVPVPHFGVGDLSPEGNWAAYIDRLFLSGHLYRPTYDPEGLLSTIPAIATALIGVLTGCWLLSDHAPEKKMIRMIGVGVIAVVVGQIWNLWFPINKALWTSSYVCFTGGLALILLAICYGLIEIMQRRSWSKFFEIFGVNALVAYAVSILLLKIQNRIPIANPDGTAGNLRLFITRHLFESWTSPMNASLFYALSYTLLWFGILRILYRKKIFIKI